jgi:ribonuclease D
MNRTPDPARVKPSAPYIADRHGLDSLCRRLANAGQIAIDTEFVGENSFVPRLELIQVATSDHTAIIDAPAVGSLDCLAAVLNEPKIEKVLHAGRQDLEILSQYCGRIPAPIFDTQLAAAMVGYGTQIAYGQLVQRVLGTKLAKGHTLTNWSQRPLTTDQLTYALDDVLFLLPLHEHLRQRLKTLGRLEWAQEEFERMGTRLDERQADPSERYQRIRGWENLKPRAAAVLRELVAWREKEAAARNVPRGRVIRDEVLLELARQAPSSVSALAKTRGLHASEVERSAESLLAVIRHALTLPERDWPQAPRSRRTDQESAGQVELLQAVLKACAEQAQIAPTLLATAGDLQALVERHREKATHSAAGLPILEGWRRTLAGDMLLRVLDGQVAASLDPRTGKVRVTPIASTGS